MIHTLLLWGWTGFTGKTLWDWLQLLFIPVLLAIGGAWFTNRQTHESNVENKDNQRETALQTYLDNLSELLLHEKLQKLTESDAELEEVQKIARVRTLTVLPRLDKARKRYILQFLYEADLIGTKRGEEDEIRDSPIIDLSGADFKGADLSYIDLRGVDLTFTEISGADLSGALLSGADLSGTDLSGATLEGTNLRDANLKGANLSKSKFWRANLSGANLSEANLSEADFSEFRVKGIVVTIMRLFGISDARVKTFMTNYFTDLLGAESADGFKSVFSGRGANLSGANLSGANLIKARLIKANLSGADFKGATLIIANFRGATLKGADLSGANLKGADFRGADLSETKGADLNGTRLKGAITPKNSLSSLLDQIEKIRE